VAEQKMWPWADPQPSPAKGWEAIEHYRAEGGRTARVTWEGGHFHWYAIGERLNEGGFVDTFEEAIAAAERAAGWRR
jgi:hypothetical protein